MPSGREDRSTRKFFDAEQFCKMLLVGQMGAAAAAACFFAAAAAEQPLCQRTQRRASLSSRELVGVWPFRPRSCALVHGLRIRWGQTRSLSQSARCREVLSSSRVCPSSRAPL